MYQIDFSDGHIVRNIFRSALPMLAAQVLNLLYNIVDRIYIGRIPGAGTAALGGVGLCFPIIILITAFTVLYGSGGSPLFSIALGKGRKDEAGAIMNTAFRLLLITGGILTLFGFLFAKPVLMLFGASGEALVYSLPYLRIYLLGTLASMTATGMNPFINGQGFPAVGMLTVTLGALSNLLLDPLFIFVLGLGVRGAAIATVISQILSACFVLRFLLRGAEIRLRPLSPSEAEHFPETAASIAALGASSFVMQITNSLVSIVCNRTLSSLGGDLYVSVMTIISSVRQIVDVPILAIAEGSSPIISFSYGAKRPAEVRRAIVTMCVMASVYAAVIWGLIVLWPAFFIRIFSTDTELVKDAVHALRLYFFAFICMMLQYGGQTTFKSLGKKKEAIFFSLLRKVFIVVPLTLLLPLFVRPATDGVFLAEPVSNVIGGAACFFTMLHIVWPELKRMENP